MGATALHSRQVPGSRPEPVGNGGERPHGADLHGVAGEIGAEGLVGERLHLGAVAPVGELDQRVAGDLLGEPRAAGAQDAPLPVQVHQVGDGDRFFEMALLFHEAALARPVAHCLVLEGALPAAVAHRAVERVVDEEELEDAFLSLLDRGAGGVHHHALGDAGGAGGGHDRAPGRLQLDETHAAHSHRVHPRMPAEVGDIGAVLDGRLDDQLAGGNLDRTAIDSDVHRVSQWGSLPRARAPAPRP